MGLCGSGKSYIGEILRRRAGFHWYEADDDLTPAMRRAISRAESFTEAMRDEFFERVYRRIVEQSRLHPYVVVTQATYKRRHRELLKRIPGLEIVWVRSPLAKIVERLNGTEGLLNAEYAQAIERHFEQPDGNTLTIVNDEGEEKIVAQLMALFEQETGSSARLRVAV